MNNPSESYTDLMREHFPNNWPVVAFDWWVEYCWINAEQPTFEQWQAHCNEASKPTAFQVPESYHRKMVKQFPGHWPIEARSWWIRYNFNHGNCPTLGQWRSHLDNKRRYQDRQQARKQKNTKAHMEGLKKLYGAVK